MIIIFCFVALDNSKWRKYVKPRIFLKLLHGIIYTYTYNYYLTPSSVTPCGPLFVICVEDTDVETVTITQTKDY